MSYTNMSRDTLAADVNRIDIAVKEISLILRDLSGKMDLLLDARTAEIPQASPARKPVGRGKVTTVKKTKVTEPEEEQPEQPDTPAEPAAKAAAKAAVDEPASDDEFTVKKPVKAKAKPAKPAAFNKLTAFTQAYKADSKRFNTYFTKQVRAEVDALPEVAGLTGDKLENARCRALYQTTVANFPEIFDELKADFIKAHAE
jgi:hypothetical protein